LKILLHICCAPCAVYPVETLRKEGHEIAGLFYNPNIHPYTEYLKRKDAVKEYAGKIGLEVHYGEYEIEKFFQHIVYDEGSGERCPVCWWLRMENAARFAYQKEFKQFTTTLLGSPYQDHRLVKSICEDISHKTGVGFYYKDFRAGFREGHKRAKDEGVYFQKYCGCIFSERDRYYRKENPERNQDKSDE